MHHLDNRLFKPLFKLTMELSCFPIITFCILTVLSKVRASEFKETSVQTFCKCIIRTMKINTGSKQIDKFRVFLKLKSNIYVLMYG